MDLNSRIRPFGIDVFPKENARSAASVFNFPVRLPAGELDFTNNSHWIGVLYIIFLMSILSKTMGLKIGFVMSILARTARIDR
jgi:hypothetical protein